MPKEKKIRKHATMFINSMTNISRICKDSRSTILDNLQMQKLAIKYCNAIDVIRELAEIWKANSDQSGAVSPLEKRPLIIDGENVMNAHHSHSLRAIQICLEFFAQENFDAKVVLSEIVAERLSAEDPSISKDLNDLYQNGVVVFTKRNESSGDSGDQKVVLEMAAQMDGVILSNHNYSEFLGIKSEWDTIINGHIVGFAFYSDMLLLPKDPYGRRGKQLYDILIK